MGKIKISGGLKEDGVFVGNSFDKYASKNPIVKWIMKGFETSLTELVSIAAPNKIHEIGCGEGYWVLKWTEQGIAAKGSDFSDRIIEIARNNAINRGFSPSLFESRNIYDLNFDKDGADLIVCCEVFEHLENPEEGLRVLKNTVSGYLIISVPREPLWRILNLVRGKYVLKIGNTPGHIQHWSKKDFLKLVSKYFDIFEIKSPLPWTMVLCRVKNDSIK